MEPCWMEPSNGCAVDGCEVQGGDKADPHDWKLPFIIHHMKAFNPPPLQIWNTTTSIRQFNLNKL